MRTIEIVVCDDDRAVQEILRRNITEYCAGSELPVRVTVCGSGAELLQAAPPDILFLDIQMPGINGMETAERLRQQDCGTVLIFVTALPEYVYDAFDVGAFHYLVKPFSDEKLYRVLERALQCALSRLSDGGGQEGVRAEDGAGGRQTSFVVRCGGVSTHVAFDDIIYAEVFNRKVMLHTVGGDIEYYGKLTDLSQAAGPSFYRTHRGYLINLKYVEKYTTSTVWLQRGTALVSKKNFPGFARRYMQYLAGQHGE